MTQRKPIGEDCDRCFGTKKRATHRIRFVIRGVPYETCLCDDHQVMFDRDMQAWTRMARELGATPLTGPTTDPDQRGKVDPPAPIGKPYRPPSQRYRPDPAPLVVSRGEVIDHDADQVTPFVLPDDIRPETIERWSQGFTDHARERMVLRNVTAQEVLRVIQSTDKTIRRPGKPGADDTALYIRGDVKVIVNERTRIVLTVGRPSLEIFDAEAI